MTPTLRRLSRTRIVALPLLAVALLGVRLGAQGFDGLAPLRPGETASTVDASLAAVGGDLSSSSHNVSAVVRTALNEATGYSIGFALETHRFDKPTATPMPEWLGATTLNLGLTQRFSPQTSFLARVALGSFSDLSSARSDTFNATGVLGVMHAQSRELVWFGGVIFDGFGKNPVLPVAGVRWQFAPEWTLNLLFPAPRVEYKVSNALTVYAGLFAEGGAFRVEEKFGTKFARPSLNNAVVDYSAWGFGPGATWKLDDSIRFSVTTGRTFRREWDFHRAGVKLKADDTWFAQAALSARF